MKLKTRAITCAESFVLEATMLLQIRACASYQLPRETFVLLVVEPALAGALHHCNQSSLSTSHTLQTKLWQDIYGNLVRRMAAPQDEFSFEYNAIWQ